ncbi:MAG: hypothetical protein OSA06_05610 [Acidimicrobiales bacterium]|nr:hypothetical protein [Acidimicrobiales bacterium]
MRSFFTIILAVSILASGCASEKDEPTITLPTTSVLRSTTTLDRGPLALVADSVVSLEAAMGIATLSIGENCVRLLQEHQEPVTPLWPARSKWDPKEQSISLDGVFVTDGDQINVGGTGEVFPDWVEAPHPDCPQTFWAVHSIVPSSPPAETTFAFTDQGSVPSDIVFYAESQGISIAEATEHHRIRESLQPLLDTVGKHPLFVDARIEREDGYFMVIIFSGEVPADISQMAADLPVIFEVND